MRTSMLPLKAIERKKNRISVQLCLKWHMAALRENICKYLRIFSCVFQNIFFFGYNHYYSSYDKALDSGKCSLLQIKRRLSMTILLHYKIYFETKQVLVQSRIYISLRINNTLYDIINMILLSHAIQGR